MATHDEKSWWELEGKSPPHETPFDAEREHLRAERARAWCEPAGERERRRARTSVPARGNRDQPTG